MSFISKLLQRVQRPTTKQLVVAGVFSLALAGSIALGVGIRGTTSAAIVRDCKTNSIDYAPYPNAGECGAATPAELIADIKHNVPGDLQSFYNFFGLNSTNYQQFSDTAVAGTLFRNGELKVNNQTVLTGAVTVGRTNFGNNRTPLQIGPHTYYWSPTQDSFADGVASLPVMVMFSDKGVAKIAVVDACGNTVGGYSVTPSVTCKALQAKQDAGNPNKWSFTTSAAADGNAVISRVVYHFSDTNTDVTKTSLTDAVTHTFAKDGDVTVTVFAKVPGGHEISAVVIANCKKHITHVAPMYVCTALVASVIDDKTFRFTIKTAQDANTTVKNADFILDGNNAKTGVTTKDADGNITTTFAFEDLAKHTVSVTVFFNTLEGVKSDSGNCKATVQRKEQPKCTVPGHENELPNSPTCGYCKPGVPIGSPSCSPPPPHTPPPELSDTGAGGTIGLFGATVIAGFFAHKFFLNRRKSTDFSL